MSIWLEYVHYFPNLLKPNDNTADNLPLQWAVTGLLSQWVELENWIRPICEQIIQTTFMNWKNWFIDSFFSYELLWTHEVKPWWMSRFSVYNNFNFNLSTSNLMVLVCIFLTRYSPRHHSHSLSWNEIFFKEKSPVVCHWRTNVKWVWNFL